MHPRRRTLAIIAAIIIIPVVLASLFALAKAPLVTNNTPASAIHVETNRYSRKDGSMDATIDFWGKVVDESGKPIPAANVAVSIRSWGKIRAAIGNAEFTRYNLTTDQDGHFLILDQYGDSLQLAISKPGYSLPQPQAVNFGYGRPFDFVPNKDKPQTFTLMSNAVQAGSEALRFDFRSPIRTANGSLSFDLVRNVSSPTGEITVSFNRDPAVLKLGNRNFSWNFRLQINNGGIIVADDTSKSRFDSKIAFLTEAPMDGYVPFVEKTYKAGETNWKGGEVIVFYFRTGTNFGKAVLEIHATLNESKIPVILSGVLNPNGSRTLGGK